MNELEHRSEEELEELLNSTASILKEKRDNRRNTAIAQIREIAAAAKITVTIKGERKAKAATDEQTDTVDSKLYRHPDNHEIIWNGKGNTPKWLRTLIKSGRDKTEFEILEATETAE